MRIQAIWLFFPLVVLLVPAVAGAQGANDYAARWALQAGGDARAWQVEPDDTVLASVQDPAFGDLQVFNAAGEAVPTARMPSTPAPAAPRWLPARFASGGPADGAAGDAGVMNYAYRLPASLAVDAVRITLGTQAPSANVALQYRQGSDWVTAARMAIAGMDATAAAATGAVDDVPANEARFAKPVIAHEWRLRSAMVLAPAPTLQVAWRPVRFVFLARGAGPYTLAVGSPTLRRSEQALDPELAQLRDRADASLPLATLGPQAAAPFVAAVAPAPATDGWRRWLGAGSILAIAGVLAAFALRRRRAVPRAV
jgi:hypothetical protein